MVNQSVLGCVVQVIGAATVLLLLIQCIVPSTEATSYTQTYSYVTTGQQYNCYPYTYTTCNTYYNYYGWYYWPYWRGWWWYGWWWWYPYRDYCVTNTAQNCYWQSYTYTAIGTMCQTGYGTYPACDTPICSPACTSPNACTAPNKCTCLTSGGTACPLNSCTPASLNCYPGTCNTGANTCVCPAGFNGPNCQNITMLPQIQSCTAQLFATQSGGNPTQVGVTNCAAPGLTPTSTWIGLSAGNAGTLLTTLSATWQSQYNNRLSLPTGYDAPYINNAPTSIGVTSASLQVAVGGAGGTYNVACPGASVGSQNNPSTLPCTNNVPWSNLGFNVQHNTTLLLTFSAGLGGQKTGASFSIQTFAGNSATRSAQFQFDFLPPSHCLLVSSNCSVFPIYLNQTITSNSKIQPTFNAWTDDGSGIGRFHIDMYYLQPDVTGLVLDSTGGPIRSADMDSTQIGLNDFIYDCQQSGTYSIVLTVYDNANNSAMARKILTYNSQQSIVDTGAPLTMSGANPATNYTFITDIQTPQNGADYQFTINWPGRFVSTFNPAWLLPVKRLTPAPNTIDDIYGTAYSQRSTDRVGNITGVLLYTFAYSVDQVGGVGAQPPTTFNTSITNVNNPSYTFSVPQNQLLVDGSTIVMWLNAYDLNMNQYQATTRVSIYRNPNINVTNPTFSFHYGGDQYSSAFMMNVFDSVGGIQSIVFNVYDQSLQINVTQPTAFNIITRSHPTQSGRKKRANLFNPCNPGDPTCYCIPIGNCYNLTQVMVIDNCAIDRYAGDTLVIYYTITDVAGYSASSSYKFLSPPQPSDIPCRPVPHTGLSAGAIVGIVIACIIGFLLCILLILVLLRWRRPQSLPRRLQNLTMYNKTPAQNKTTDNEIYAANETVPTKYDNTPSKSNNVMNNKRQMAYVAKEEQTQYSATPGRLSAKDVRVDSKILGDGRFAIVKMGFLHQGNKQIPVAVKALKTGYSKGDTDIMNKKIQFMSKLSHHVNLVNYLGTYQEDITGSAPAMVLDYCETQLTTWLAAIKTVTPDTLDSMLTFTHDIARGMEHLHSCDVLHRHLCAKNVLLINSVSGLTVKLIGYGPSKDDGTAGTDHQAQPIVKIKWTAPETLATLKTVEPVYNEKTDTWSYGVTIWEIFSKGAAPYPDVNSGDLLKKLKAGHHLSCPKDCDPDLFEKVILPCWNVSPKVRPNFTKICDALSKYRRMEDGPGLGYYGADDIVDDEDKPEGYYGADQINNNDSDEDLEVYDDTAR